jgi:hypothetical protein
MKIMILKAIALAVILFELTACETEHKCPANNGGYMELKKPGKKTISPNMVYSVQKSAKHGNI